MTRATMKVLEALDQAPPELEMYGLRICQRTGLGSGTVYPVLDRLERAGWVTGTWVESKLAPGPARRRYTVSEGGRGGLRRARRMRQARAERWRRAIGLLTPVAR